MCPMDDTSDNRSQELPLVDSNSTGELHGLQKKLPSLYQKFLKYSQGEKRNHTFSIRKQKATPVHTRDEHNNSGPAKESGALGSILEGAEAMDNQPHHLNCAFLKHRGHKGQFKYLLNDKLKFLEEVDERKLEEPAISSEIEELLVCLPEKAEQLSSETGGVTVPQALSNEKAYCTSSAMPLQKLAKCEKIEISQIRNKLLQFDGKWIVGYNEDNNSCDEALSMKMCLSMNREVFNVENNVYDSQQSSSSIGNLTHCQVVQRTGSGTVREVNNWNKRCKRLKTWNCEEGENNSEQLVKRICASNISESASTYTSLSHKMGFRYEDWQSPANGYLSALSLFKDMGRLSLSNRQNILQEFLRLVCGMSIVHVPFPVVGEPLGVANVPTEHQIFRLGGHCATTAVVNVAKYMLQWPLETSQKLNALRAILCTYLNKSQNGRVQCTLPERKQQNNDTSSQTIAMHGNTISSVEKNSVSEVQDVEKEQQLVTCGFHGPLPVLSNVPDVQSETAEGRVQMRDNGTIQRKFLPSSGAVVSELQSFSDSSLPVLSNVPDVQSETAEGRVQMRDNGTIQRKFLPSSGAVVSELQSFSDSSLPVLSNVPDVQSETAEGRVQMRDNGTIQRNFLPSSGAVVSELQSFSDRTFLMPTEDNEEFSVATDELWTLEDIFASGEEVLPLHRPTVEKTTYHVSDKKQDNGEVNILKINNMCSSNGVISPDYGFWEADDAVGLLSQTACLNDKLCNEQCNTLTRAHFPKRTEGKRESYENIFQKYAEHKEKEVVDILCELLDDHISNNKSIQSSPPAHKLTNMEQSEHGTSKRKRKCVSESVEVLLQNTSKYLPGTSKRKRKCVSGSVEVLLQNTSKYLPGLQDEHMLEEISTDATCNLSKEAHGAPRGGPVSISPRKCSSIDSKSDEKSGFDSVQTNGQSFPDCTESSSSPHKSRKGEGLVTVQTYLTDECSVKKTSKKVTRLKLTCQYCGKRFFGTWKLKEHIGTHTLPYHCTRCGRRFARESQLVTHRQLMSCSPHETCHYKCEGCDQKFLQRVCLLNHVEKHLKQDKKEKVDMLRCKLCGKVFSQAKLLKLHEEVHAKGQLYTCRVCGKRFKWQPDLATHQRLHQKCSYCGDYFIGKVSLRTHISQHLKEEEEKALGQKRKVRREENITRDQFTGTFPIIQRELSLLICPDCGKLFRWKTALQQHLAEHEREDCKKAAAGRQRDRFHCDDCGNNFRSRVSLRSHACHEALLQNTIKYLPGLQAEHLLEEISTDATCNLSKEAHGAPRVGPVSISPRKCSSIDCKTDEKSGFETVQTNGQSFPDCTESSANSNKRCKGGGLVTVQTYLTDECSVKKTSKEGTEVKLTCQYCGKQFYTPWKLRQHIGTHTLPYHCTRCGRRFARESQLVTHEQQMSCSPDETCRYKCKGCDQKFLQKVCLLNHVEKHFKQDKEERVDKSRCKLCGKVFNQAKLLLLHEKVHVTKGRLHTCRVCGKTFERQARLDRHQRLHLKCSYCGDYFKGKEPLRTHIRQHLKDEKEKALEQKRKVQREENKARDEVAVAFPIIQRELSVQICPECGKIFRWKTALQQHLAEHELDDRKKAAADHQRDRFHCDNCGNNFRSSVSLRSHVCQQERAKADSSSIKVPWPQHRQKRTGSEQVACTSKSIALKFSCEKCHAEFTEWSELQQHSCGLDDRRPYMCYVCDKTFLSARQLSRHMLFHFPRHRCRYCDHTFARRYEWRYHEWGHENIGPKAATGGCSNSL